MRMRVPDKKTVMCGFLIRPFYFAGRERNGLINRENPTNLLQVSVGGIWKCLITSIYSIVDMAMVGQYHGPEGSAALAVGGSGLEHHLQFRDS